MRDKIKQVNELCRKDGTYKNDKGQSTVSLWSKIKYYIRTRNGQAFFQYVERFDSAEKAADPSNEGELVEVVVNEINGITQ